MAKVVEVFMVGGPAHGITARCHLGQDVVVDDGEGERHVYEFEDYGFEIGNMVWEYSILVHNSIEQGTANLYEVGQTYVVRKLNPILSRWRFDRKKDYGPGGHPGSGEKSPVPEWFFEHGKIDGVAKA